MPPDIAHTISLRDRGHLGLVSQFLGRHRFQLALLTQTVRSVIEKIDADGADSAPDPGPYRLRPRDSVIDALDTFQTSGRTSLPVYQRQTYWGMLTKRQLLQAVSRTLGEAPTVAESPSWNRYSRRARMVCAAGGGR